MDSKIVSTAGCCLHLLRSQCGAEAANAVARRPVVQPHRQGGQAQFIEQPIPPSPALNPFTAALEWARAHLDRPHSSTAWPSARTSRRSFSRRFQKETGTTVWAWLMHQRLAFAQRLLETTDHSIDHVATLAGFESAVSLRLRFRETLGTSPTTYRRHFRGK